MATVHSSYEKFVRKLFHKMCFVRFFMCAIFFFFIELFYTLKRRSSDQSLYDCSKLHKNLSGCVCLVVGVTDGQMGHHIIKRLIKSNCHLIITLYGDEKYAKQTKIDLINNELKHVDSSLYRFEHVDLTSFQSIIEFVKKLNDLEQKINFFISNAGVFYSDLIKTEDGFESQLQTNYLGACLLLIGILPLLVKTAIKSIQEIDGKRSKIIFTCSNAYNWFKFDLDQLDYVTHDFETNFNGYKMYASTKQFQLMFNMHLFDQIFKRNKLDSLISFFEIHPGTMKTGISIDFAKKNHFVHKMVLLFLKSSGEGAVNVSIPVLSSQETFNSNEFLYLEDLYVIKPTGDCMNQNFREQLYRKTLSLLRKQIEQLSLPDYLNPLLN